MFSPITSFAHCSFLVGVTPFGRTDAVRVSEMLCDTRHRLGTHCGPHLPLTPWHGGPNLRYDKDIHESKCNTKNWLVVNVAACIPSYVC